MYTTSTITVRTPIIIPAMDTPIDALPTLRAPSMSPSSALEEEITENKDKILSE